MGMEFEHHFALDKKVTDSALKNIFGTFSKLGWKYEGKYWAVGSENPVEANLAEAIPNLIKAGEGGTWFQNLQDRSISFSFGLRDAQLSIPSRSIDSKESGEEMLKAAETVYNELHPLIGFGSLDLDINESRIFIGSVGTNAKKLLQRGVDYYKKAYHNRASVFVCHFFGPKSLEGIDRKKLLSAPVWRIKEFDDGGVMVVAYPFTLNWGKKEFNKKEIANYLIEVFKGKGWRLWK